MPSHPPYALQPLSADNFTDDLVYADMEFSNYGPINYKAASVYAMVKKNQNDARLNELPHQRYGMRE